MGDHRKTRPELQAQLEAQQSVLFRELHDLLPTAELDALLFLAETYLDWLRFQVEPDLFLSGLESDDDDPDLPLSGFLPKPAPVEFTQRLADPLSAESVMLAAGLRYAELQDRLTNEEHEALCVRVSRFISKRGTPEYSDPELVAALEKPFSDELLVLKSLEHEVALANMEDQEPVDPLARARRGTTFH